MTTFYCSDTTHGYDVALYLINSDGCRRISDPDCLLECTCNDLADCDGFVITTQAQFDSRIASLRARIERANTTEDYEDEYGEIASRDDGMTWVLDVKDRDVYSDIKFTASFLYGGGWRAADRERLMEFEGDDDEDYADIICAELKKLEEMELAGE